MGKMKKLLSLEIVAALVVSFSVLPSSAYNLLGSGKLAGGIYNRTYYIGCSSYKYINAFNAEIEDWNWALNPYDNGNGVDFYFRKVSSSARATICFWEKRDRMNHGLVKQDYLMQMVIIWSITALSDIRIGFMQASASIQPVFRKIMLQK